MMIEKQIDPDIPLLIGLLLLTLLPHVFGLSPWIFFWVAGCWAYRLLAARKQWPLPGILARHVITIIGILSVVLTAGYRLGVETCIGLTAVMAALKPFEIKTYRDKVVTVLLAYFIIISSLFESEDFIYILHMILSVLTATAILIHLHDPLESIWNKLRLAGRIMLQAMPLMLILFFLFPRIQGSLWNLSTGKKGRTGFSDSLSIGDVAQLVQDDAAAFTVRFDGKLPPMEDRYWRGVVFDRFSGFRWTTSLGPIEPLPSTHQGNETTYTVTLPPHSGIHLFTLDLPLTHPQFTRVQAGFTLQANTRVVQKFHYTVTSTLRDFTGPFHSVRELPRSLPAQGNAKARQLAASIARQAGSTPERVSLVLAYFKTNHFTYTLKPPPLHGDAIDQFLFETRKGYCEHFASAFVFLMRAAGVPARIVGGYLGGEANPYGNFLTVRQADAHAWAEVWLDTKGWVRVDPTAAVAPERITEGIAAALPPEELPPGIFSTRIGLSLLQKLQYGWDAFNNQWDVWFSGYSADQQKNLLRFLGFKIESWTRQALLLSLGICLSAIAIIFVFIPRRRRSSDPADQALRLYQQFCARLARNGIARLPWQGPIDFAESAAARLPQLSPQIYEITHLYVRLRYAESKRIDELRRLKQYVSRIKIS